MAECDLMQRPDRADVLGPLVADDHDAMPSRRDSFGASKHDRLA